MGNSHEEFNNYPDRFILPVLNAVTVDSILFHCKSADRLSQQAVV
jgi:hypothetical protein